MKSRLLSCGCLCMRTEPKLCCFLVSILSLSLTFVGCARFHSQPLSASANANALESRSLTNTEIKLFLEKNLHRDLSNWPEVEWDFEMLTLAAFYYHPSLEVARAQWAVAKGGEVTAGQRPNPTLTVTPTYNFTTLVPSRSEEHTSELQSHSFISYAVFCLKKKNNSR